MEGVNVISVNKNKGLLSGFLMLQAVKLFKIWGTCFSCKTSEKTRLGNPANGILIEDTLLEVYDGTRHKLVRKEQI